MHTYAVQEGDHDMTEGDRDHTVTKPEGDRDLISVTIP